MNTRQLEAQSDAERREVESTVGEIRRRLSPGQLLDEVLAYTKDGGGEFISDLGRQATDNPIPVSLIGAGLAWFLFSKGGQSTAARSRNTYSSSSTGTRSGYTATDAASTASEAGRKTLDAISDGLGAAKDHLSGAIEEASSTLDGLKSDVTAASQSAKDRLSDSANSVRGSVQSAKSSATAAVNSAGNFLKEQPLIILGAGLVLGAAVGAGVPTTEAEGRVMGEASDKVKRQAKEAVSDQLDQAKALGENLYEGIKNELREGVADLSNMRPN